jgi:hypothetical protein
MSLSSKAAPVNRVNFYAARNQQMKLLSSIALVFTCSAHLCADDVVTITAVQAADDERIAAMVAGDAKRLDAILSEELHYGHSSKLIENKTEHITSLVSRRLIYHKVDYQTRDFSLIAPGVVLGKGRALVDVGSKRMIFRVDINFISVWRLENQRWRLFAWQSCRNEEVVPLAPPPEETLKQP